MLGGVLAARLVAAADMAATAADPQMKPFPAQGQAFLAAFGAGRDLMNGTEMAAEIPCHLFGRCLLFQCCAPFGQEGMDG